MPTGVFINGKQPDMGQLELDLSERKDLSVARTFVLKASGTHAGEANNFTSYDAFVLGLTRADLAYGTEGLFLAGFDVVNGQAGQMEYLQVQVTVHTAPNRADSDGDGLNDSEEANLGRDGSAMKPQPAESGGDRIVDDLGTQGWSTPAPRSWRAPLESTGGREPSQTARFPSAHPPLCPA